MNMKKKYLWIAVVLWMTAIFAFSARPADLSAKDSRTVGYLVGSIFVPGFENLSAMEQMELVERIDYPVRKISHGTEYAVLAILLFLAWGEGNGRRITAWGGASLYAASDEFHQLFVSGRSGQITDVMIDSLGAAVGVVFACIALRFICMKMKD